MFDISTTSGPWFKITGGEIIERSWGAPVPLQALPLPQIRAAGWFPGIVSGDPRPDTLQAQGVTMAEVLAGDVVQVTYSPIPHTIETIRPLAKAMVTDWRWRRECAGVVVGGMSVKTDRDSQAMINGAFAAAQAGVLTHFDFKATDGWISLTAAQVQAVAGAVAQHVQASFTAERLKHEKIDALVSVAAIQQLIAELGA